MKIINSYQSIFDSLKSRIHLGKKYWKSSTLTSVNFSSTHSHYEFILPSNKMRTSWKLCAKRRRVTRRSRRGDIFVTRMHLTLKPVRADEQSKQNILSNTQFIESIDTPTHWNEKNNTKNKQPFLPTQSSSNPAEILRHHQP